MHEAFYSVDRLRLRYLEWGNAGSDAIVLVHGFSTTATAWARVGKALAPNYHVVAPDLRGHGQSEWDRRERYSDEQLAADVRVLVQKLALPPFTLIGHSMAARSPSRMQRPTRRMSSGWSLKTPRRCRRAER